MATNVIASQIPNQFRISIDNTKCSNDVSNIRASLLRTVNVTLFDGGDSVLKVEKEEIGSATCHGGPKN